MVAMLDRRHLAQRVNGEIALVLHPVVRNQLGLVRSANLFEHPADDPPARLRIRVEDELGHFALP